VTIEAEAHGINTERREDRIHKIRAAASGLVGLYESHPIGRPNVYPFEWHKQIARPTVRQH
jgi:hypothetical protein